jgi:hypothetical protein
VIASPETHQAIGHLFRRALLLRLGLAVVLHYAVSESTFAPDQETYHFFSAWLAHYWSGDNPIYPTRLLLAGEPIGYYQIVATIYYLFGDWSLLPKLFNAFVGARTVGLVYDLAQRISDSEAIGLRAATYAAYFPSLVLWSSLNIRDCWLVLLLILISREAVLLQDSFRAISLLRAAAAVYAITLFRPYLLFAVTLPVLLSFLIRKRAHLVRNASLGMLLAVVVVYADQASSQRKLRTIDFEELQKLRQWSSTAAASGFAVDADISTPEKALLFLPIGLTYFLLAPFPWMLGSIRQIVAVPEMLFFYSLLPSIVRGGVAMVRNRLSSSLMIILVTISVTFGYAIGQGNVGTIYRHRAQVLCFYLIFAAVGVELKRQGRYPLPTPSRVLVHAEARSA